MKDFIMDALLLAGGSGQRFGAGQNKVYLNWQGKPLLTHSLEVLAASPFIRKIVLVIRPEDEAQARAIVASFPAVRLTFGGSTRSASVEAGLRCLTEGPENNRSLPAKSSAPDAVLIQDAARPRLRPEYIAACAQALQEGFEGCSVAIPSKDTVKITDEHGVVLSTTPRAHTWLIQTPQAFRLAPLLSAHALYGADPDVTDDCMLIERAGGRVKLLPGRSDNIKLTTPEDWNLLDALPLWE